MPWLELRTVLDGRTVCYAPHTHETFSIGAITGGQSLYINGTQRRQVQTGDLVIINPEQVHACNPLTDAAWAYHMFYVDVTWLAGLQYELGFTPAAAFQPFATTLSADPALYAGLTRLAASLHEARAITCCSKARPSPSSANCNWRLARHGRRASRRITNYNAPLI